MGVFNEGEGEAAAHHVDETNKEIDAKSSCVLVRINSI